MKLLTGNVDQSDRQVQATLALCVAHRCLEHRQIPPLNMNEGNGSSECGVCAAEEFGARLAEQALAKQDELVILPILDGYAARLAYGAELRAKLQTARDRLNLLSPGAGDFLDEESTAEASSDRAL